MTRKPWTGLTEEQQRLSDLRLEACKDLTGQSTPEEIAKAQAASDAFNESLSESMREYYESLGFFERLRSRFSFSAASVHDPRNPSKRTPRERLKRSLGFSYAFLMWTWRRVSGRL
jgi:hypothetical protein